MRCDLSTMILVLLFMHISGAPGPVGPTGNRGATGATGATGAAGGSRKKRQAAGCPGKYTACSVMLVRR